MKNSFGGNKLEFCSNGINSSNISEFIHPGSKLNSESIYDFLLFGTILPPSSPIEGVSTSLPGDVTDGTNEYDILDFSISKKTLNEFVQEFDSILTTYFDKYKDKSNTVLLSGGIDSAIILSYLGKNTKCVTWGGWGEGSSDVVYSKITAKQFGIRDHYFTYADYEQDIEEYKNVVRSLKIPILFSNSVPYIKMSKLATSLGISNWFMGQNADTVLLSYAPEVAVRKLAFFNQFLPFNPFALLPNRKKYLFGTDNILKLFAYFKSNGIFPGEWIKVPDKYFEKKEKLITPFIKGNLSQKIIITEELLTEARRNQICQNEVPGHFGIDVHCPFYSKEFVELALQIPDRFRKLDNYDKVIFKELAKKRGVPNEVIYKEKKGLSYDYKSYIKSKKHLPMWDKMEKDDFINMFVDIKKIRRENEDNFTVFDMLSSLYYYGELVVKPDNIKY